MSKLGVWKKPSGKKLTTDKCAKVSYIVYPDSCNEGWIDYLRDLNLKVAISPLHDKDEDIKPHYHVVIIYPQSVPWTTWDEFREGMGAFKNFEKLRSSQGMVNYLTHDSYTSQDKPKYLKEDIMWINCNELDFMEDQHIRIINFIEENHILTFRSLINSLLENKGYEGQKLVAWITKNVMFTNTYLKSFSNKYKNQSIVLT